MSPVAITTRRRKVVVRDALVNRWGKSWRLLLDCGHTVFRKDSERGEFIQRADCWRCEPVRRP